MSKRKLMWKAAVFAAPLVWTWYKRRKARTGVQTEPVAEPRPPE